MRTRTKYGATAAGAALVLAVLRRRMPSPVWWAGLVSAGALLGGWAWRYMKSPE